MNKSLIIVFILFLFYSCSNKTSELTGSKNVNLNFTESNPAGMIYVKKGTFLMGIKNESKMFTQEDKVKPVTVQAFWMDQTEVTNAQYKQFVNWVRDSIAYRALIMAGRDEFRMKIRNQEEEDSPEKARINWSVKIPWNSKDEEIQEILAFMYYGQNDVIDGKRQLNPSKLVYRYEQFNYDQAVLEKNKFNIRTESYPQDATVSVDTAYIDETGKVINKTITRKLSSRSDFISVKMVNIYPDTVSWSSDFKFAYNLPKMEMYFSHPGYAMYPVVGVSWEQATAYCHWRTSMYNAKNRIKIQEYRLPTEAEWEFAARAGVASSTYPWKGDHMRDDKGCFLANFKQTSGNYLSDNSSTTVRVASYPPNRFGLYDMAGNVAEWTSTAYHKLSGTVTSDLNPNFEYNAKADDPASLKRKVVKGGSWKDIPYYLQCGAQTYEYQYESRPYIGFRCVRSFNGDN